jgi:hypothetical protein
MISEVHPIKTGLLLNDPENAVRKEKKENLRGKAWKSGLPGANRLKPLKYMTIALWGLIFLCLANNKSSAADLAAAYRLCPLKVGQSVEYQITGIFGKDKDDCYNIAVTGKELISEREYFWIKMDIFSAKKKEISFKALISPFVQEEFSSNPRLYISEGMLVLLKGARRLLISTGNNYVYYPVSPEILSGRPEILADSIYSRLPYEQNSVSYAKLKIDDQEQLRIVPAGVFRCGHFVVKTDKQQAYTDEGFDLWRSEKVPFLGIVEMEFSKTLYQQKRDYRYGLLLKTGNWLEKLHAFFFLRRRYDISRKDSFDIRLISYNSGDNDSAK